MRLSANGNSGCRGRLIQVASSFSLRDPRRVLSERYVGEVHRGGMSRNTVWRTRNALLGATQPLTPSACTMHSTCMATKTISLKLEAYEKLRAARRYPDESFSQVVLRARWPEETVTAAELLQLCGERAAHLTEDELDRIEKLKESDVPAEDKWQTR